MVQPQLSRSSVTRSVTLCPHTGQRRAESPLKSKAVPSPLLRSSRFSTSCLLFISVIFEPLWLAVAVAVAVAVAAAVAGP